MIFTDSIPLLAVPFKILSPLLPKDFQYFGLWGLLCLVLQAVLGAHILRAHTSSRLYAGAGGLLLMLAPVMFRKMFAQTAVVSHWLILMAMIPLFTWTQRRPTLRRVVLFSAALGLLCSEVHIYLLFIAGICIFAWCVGNSLAEKGIRTAGVALGAFLVAAGVTIALLGGFSMGASAGGEGVGWYSANLNALINPMQWSALLKDRPIVAEGQGEGYGYPGFGLLVMMGIAAFSLPQSGRARAIIRRYR